MTIGYPTTTPSFKGNPYDRAPLNIVLGYDANAAPHALTTRVTYTVPALRKAVISGIYNYARRGIVAAPVSTWEIFTSVTPSGGAAVIIADVITTQNAVDNVIQAIAVPQYVLLAGDNIVIRTVDLSTGGNVTYAAALYGTEFDA